jgi:hypothetical protein
VIIDPVTWQVTHFVIQESSLSGIERLVPIGWVVMTTPDLVRLRCKKSELAAMELFVESQHARVSRPDYRDSLEFEGICSVHHTTDWVSIRRERIPPGELFVRRGARVSADDGQVGRVDEFLVYSTTRQITHLVLRGGHLWRQKDVLVPISEISRAGEDAVSLKLDRHAIGSLPAVPARQWRNRKGSRNV